MARSCGRPRRSRLSLRLDRLAISEQVHPPPCKLAEQLTQLRRHPLEVGVMAQPRLERRTGHARLARVDFPRMEVEHCRTRVASVDLADRPATESVRQHAEETAAACR